MQWRKALAIINPRAGRWGSEKSAPRLLERVARSSGRRIDRRIISGSSDARVWAQHAHAEGYDLVILVGGDGTIHEAVSGMNSGTMLPIAILPSGSGNVLAHECNIPTQLAKAVRCLEDGELRSIDIGVVSRHRQTMMNAVAIGYGSLVITDARQELKNVLGYPAYILTALQRMVRIKRARFDCVFDGVPQTFYAQMLMVMNVHLESLHLHHCEIPITPDDGYFDVLVFSHANFQEFVRLAAGVVLGAPLAAPALPHVRARSLSITTVPPLPLSIDGESYHSEGTIALSALPGRLKILVPRHNKNPHRTTHKRA